MKDITTFINESTDGYAVVAILSGMAGNFKPVTAYTHNFVHNDLHPGAGVDDQLEDLFNVDYRDILEYDFEQMPERKAKDWMEKRSEELLAKAKEKYEKNLYR